MRHGGLSRDVRRERRRGLHFRASAIKFKLDLGRGSAGSTLANCSRGVVRPHLFHNSRPSSDVFIDRAMTYEP